MCYNILSPLIFFKGIGQSNKLFNDTKEILGEMGRVKEEYSLIFLLQ